MIPYPAYKASGIEWLGEIPAHWEVKKLKHLGSIVLGKMLTPEDKGGYYQKPYLRAKNILWEKVDVSDVKEMWFSEQELNKYRLNLHDILISEGGEVGRTGIWKNEIEECYIQNSVHKVTIHQTYIPFYFLYLFLFYGKIGHFDAIVEKVSIGHLTREKLTEIFCLVPSLSEQRAIAAYLDHKTRLIDTYLAKKQQQIDRWQAYRTALINQAVTKGLNPAAPMKDSGVEWLGEIPVHWEVVKLKFLTTKIGSGVTPRGGSTVYQDTGIPLLRSQNIHFDGLRLKEVAYISHEIHDSMSTTKVQPNDVLLNITGASIGRCYYVDENLGEANVNQHVCILRPNDKIKTKFLFNALTSNVGQDQVFYSQNGTSREGLNFEQLKNFVIPLPSQKEQIEIIQFLETINQKIFTLIAATQQQLDRLHAYRTALVSAAVTGKMDVLRELSVKQ